MYFKYLIVAMVLGLLVSCNKKCNERQDLLLGTWTDNIARYDFRENGAYTYKFLLGSNPTDSLSVVDSAVGSYKIDNCQKVIALTQEGYYPLGDSSEFVLNRINFGTWKFTLTSDSLLDVETATTFKQLRRIK